MKRFASGVLVLALALACPAAVPAAAAEPASDPQVRTLEAAGGRTVRLSDTVALDASGSPDAAAFALGFYDAAGAVLAEYELGDLVVNRSLLGMRDGRAAWIAQNEIAGDALKLTTLDGQIYEFRISTGDISYLKKKY